jgi:hypothetical protein
MDYKGKKSSGLNKNKEEREKNLLHQVEDYYLRHLQESLLNGKEAVGSTNGFPSEAYEISEPGKPSGVREKRSKPADSDLLRTIRQLEQRHSELDDAEVNGGQDPFERLGGRTPLVSEEPRSRLGKETVEETFESPPAVEAKQSPQPAVSLYEPGTILKLENGSVGIFKESLPDKEYDIIYYLLPNGSIDPRGISLFSYSSERIGKIPPEYLSRLEDSMRWERDLVVYHLDSFDYSTLIPKIERISEDEPRRPSTTESVRARVASRPISSTVQKRSSLERGRKLKIRFGNGAWEAVYWGSDNDGAILAHYTNKRWELTRLDLKPYEGSMELGDYLSSREVREIEDALLQESQ